jgi:predicted enzyme related to lactoylglutathione lyase
MDLLVNIDVPDLKMATRFYQEAVGLSVGRTFGDAAVELVGASAPIYLLKKRPAAVGGPIHLDFVVTDLDAACAQALAAGARAEQPVEQTPFGRLAVFVDPFGHGFSLLQFSAVGYDAIADKRT